MEAEEETETLVRYLDLPLFLARQVVERGILMDGAEVGFMVRAGVRGIVAVLVVAEPPDRDTLEAAVPLGYAAAVGARAELGEPPLVQRAEQAG